MGGRRPPDDRARLGRYAAALAAMLFCLELFGVIDASIPFIYFQF